MRDDRRLGVLARSKLRRGLGSVRAFSAEVVFDPDHVVDLGGGDLEDLGALECLVPVDPAGPDVPVVQV